MTLVLNQIRIVCNDSDRHGIHVKSNLDETYRLDGHTDEAISFTDDTLVIIQNKLSRPCEILLEAIKLPEGRRACFRPARQSAFNLLDRNLSTTRSSRDLTLGPGESCTLHSSLWQSQGGEGPKIPV